jgi:hypothetical protein
MGLMANVRTLREESPPEPLLLRTRPIRSARFIAVALAHISIEYSVGAVRYVRELLERG